MFSISRICKFSRIIPVFLIFFAAEQAPCTAAAPVPEGGLWADTVVTGYLETRQQLLTEDAQAIALLQRCWLQAEYGQEYYRVFVSGHGDLDVATDFLPDHTVRKDLDLYEGYLTIDTEKVDIILGQKRYNWGTVDAISPLDVLNPVDYRYPAGTTLNQNKLPVPSMFIETSLNAFLLQGVLIPDAKFSELPLRESAWSPAMLTMLRENAENGLIRIKEEDHGTQPEIGFRIKTFQHRFDVSLVYFNGMTDDPLFEAPPCLGIPVFTEQYKTYQVFGITTAVGMEHSTLRAEISYKPDYSFQTNDYRIEEHDWLQTVAGVDWTFDNDLYLNIQGYYDLIQGTTDTLLNDATTYGITWELNKKFMHDDLLVGLSGIYVCSDDSVVGKIRMEYLIGDHWKMGCSLLVFDGDADSSYGPYDSNDLVDLSLRYTF